MPEPITAHEGHKIIDVSTYASGVPRRICTTCDVEVEPAFMLDADSLLSKWGFGDGDALSDWWWDNYGEDTPFDDRTVLHALVLAHLVPALHDAAREIDVYWIETIHNPVRTHTLDGAPVDHYSTRPWTIDPPVVVHLTRAQIVELAEKVTITRPPDG